MKNYSLKGACAYGRCRPVDDMGDVTLYYERWPMKGMITVNSLLNSCDKYGCPP